MDSDKSQQSVPEYGFGEAKHFMPLPNTVVGSHCAWEIRLNTVSGRIPGKSSLSHTIHFHTKLYLKRFKNYLDISCTKKSSEWYLLK